MDPIDPDEPEWSIPDIELLDEAGWPQAFNHEVISVISGPWAAAMRLARSFTGCVDAWLVAICAIEIAPWWWTIMSWVNDTSAELCCVSTEADPLAAGADEVEAEWSVADVELALSLPQAASVIDKAAAPMKAPKRVEVRIAVVLLMKSGSG